jgi:serine/threonine-protein kinase
MREGHIVDGRFRLGPKIREGIGSSLYAGEHLHDGSRIAAWVLDGAAHLADDIVERAQGLKALRSPHLARLIEATNTDDHVLVLIEEPIHGESLVERLARAPLSLHQSLALLDALLRGLAECHRRGVVHGDVRPENVFVSGQSRISVQLRGAGHAALLSKQAVPTIGGVIYGNPLFTAPEQWVNRTVDPATDLYAVAGLAYLLLSGRHFIEPGAAFAVCRQHFTAPRPLIDRTLVGEPVSEGLAAVLVRAASAERGQRFASADALRDALAEASGDVRAFSAVHRLHAVGVDIDDVSFNIDVSVLEEITIEAGITGSVADEFLGLGTMDLVGTSTIIASELAEIDAMPDDTLNESPGFYDEE